MNADIVIEREGAMGVVTLNRPRAINALTLAMVEAIREALKGWAADAAVRAVLIEGRGEKGFCAGGDVRLVREGGEALAERFFPVEYEVNGLIATYPKPVVALQDGIVMGGGVGLSAHARYRVSTEKSRFAMPEAGIGFFADVGVNAILAQAPEPVALAFLLSGTVVEAGDAIALGLSDTMVRSGQLPELRGRLIEGARAGEVDTVLVSALQAESAEPGEASFCRLVDSLADCFAVREVFEIVEMLGVAADEGEVGAAALLSSLKAHCPTSLAVILAGHRLARRQRDIGAILETDLALARFMTGRADFAEGVRARLVDKDGAPRWQPAGINAVDHAEIAAVLAPFAPRRR